MINQNTDELTALVFQIIHGSFVDGYGCRTTVFLKGCPLSCRWCCNPESQMSFMEVKHSREVLCTGCGKCVEVCPADAISIAGESGGSGFKTVIHRDRCTHCGNCGRVCRTGRIRIWGKPYTVDQLFEVIAKDIRHYESTGGGVTIGGGECTMNGAFTLALIRKCKENYINTAIDTCGYITDPVGLQAFDEADMVLLDIKGYDPVRHQNNTGADNRIIIENLERRNKRNQPVIIRYPLIPGFNDDREELCHTAEMLSHYPAIERVDIIPYHDYSRIKYAQLDREYPLAETGMILSPEKEKQILEYFTKYGLKTQIGG